MNIVDIIQLYLDKLETFVLDNDVKLNIYVLEKPNVNCLENKTKDGIHLIFTIKMAKAEQCFYKKIINDIKDIFQNIHYKSLQDLLDEGITKGCVKVI